jgi:hypothetical protein
MTPDSVNAQILKVRLDACDALTKLALSSSPEGSFELCTEAFRIIKSAKLSELLQRSSIAKVLNKDVLFDAADYQSLPSEPNATINETVYLLKLSHWKGTGFGIYLYFRQKSTGYVDLDRDSKDILVRVVASRGPRPSRDTKPSEGE